MSSHVSRPNFRTDSLRHRNFRDYKIVSHFGELSSIYDQLIPPNELLWHADSAIEPMLNFGCEIVAQPSFAILRKRKFVARRQRYMIGAFEEAEITTAMHN